MATHEFTSTRRHRSVHPGVTWLPVVAVVAAVLWASKQYPVLAVVMLTAAWGLLRGIRAVAGVLARRATGDSMTGHAATALSGTTATHRRLLTTHLDRPVPATAAIDPHDRPRLTDLYVDLTVGRDDRPETDQPVLGAGRRRDRSRSLTAELRARCDGPVLLLGEAGAGKTTVLRRIGLELAGHRWGHRRVPVLIDLPDHLDALTGANPPPLAALAARAEHVGGLVPAGWFAWQLARGRCVVLYDGIDEIADQADRDTVLAWIRRQARRHRRNTMLVAARPATLSHSPATTATTWRLHRMGTAQIAGFVYGWCRAVESRKPGHSGTRVRDETAAEAGVLLSRLRGNPGLRQAATNPLLLTLLAVVHRRCGFLPDNVDGLFRDATDVLIGADRVDAARDLAGFAMRRRSTRFTAAQVAHLLTPEELTEAVSGGWLTETAGRYGFVHHRLQQQLAAEAMLRSDDDTEILAHLTDPWWRPTLLAWARHRDVTAVVRACLDSRHTEALSLAFALAEHGGGLSAQLRAELPDLIGVATRTVDERRLLDVVAVNRGLRDMRRLYGGARLSARPVSRDLYAAYLDSQYPGGTRHRGGGGPAVGMWAEDAAGFVRWLNTLPRDDETMYWLPTEAEMAGALPDPAGAAVWVRDGSHPRLLPGRGPDPYTAPDGWWRRAMLADRRITTLAWYQLSSVLGSMSARLTRDLAGRMNLDRSRAYALPRELDRDRELAAARRYLRRAVPGLGDRYRGDPVLRDHLARIVTVTTELTAKALDFRADPNQTDDADLPFRHLDTLPVESRRLIVTAQLVLWLAARPVSEGLHHGQALGNLDRFLLDALPEPGTDLAQTVHPHQLTEALRAAHRSIRESADDSMWSAAARHLTADVLRRLPAALPHSGAYRVEDVTSARIAITAALASLREQVRGNPDAITRARPVTTGLCRVLAGLTVLEQRATGVIVPTEVLMVVRR